MKSNRHEREITARPRSRFAPVTSFIRWIYGRFYFNRVKRDCKHFGFFRRYGRVLAFYVFWLSPLAALADGWSEVDAGRLQHIHDDVNSISVNVGALESILRYDFKSMVNTVDRLEDEFVTAFGTNFVEAYPRGYLYAFMNKFSNSVSYDTDSIFGRLNLNFETYGQNLYINQRDIVRKLDSIISLLSENSGSGSGSAAEINQNWLTEVKYTEIANQFLTSWGFEGGSGGSFLDWFKTLVGSSGVLPTPQARKLTRYMWEFVPFPQGMPSSGLPPFWLGFEETTLTTNPSHVGQLGIINFYLNNLNENLVEFAEVSLHNTVKESWNDWQAHTNLVATIVQQADRFFHQPEDNTNTTFSDGKLITVTTSGGSSNTNEEDLTPVTTNDFAQIEQDTNSFTNSLKFLSADKIKSRYYSEGIAEVGEFNDKYAAEGSGFNSVWNLGGFTMDFSAHFDKYRILVPVSTLSKFRDGMSWLWSLVMVIASFWFALKIAGINSSANGGE